MLTVHPHIPLLRSAIPAIEAQIASEIPDWLEAGEGLDSDMRVDELPLNDLMAPASCGGIPWDLVVALPNVEWHRDSNGFVALLPLRVATPTNLLQQREGVSGVDDTPLLPGRPVLLDTNVEHSTTARAPNADTGANFYLSLDLPG